MTQEIIEAMTRPDANGTPTLPKRTGGRGLMPSTWLGRSLRIEYAGAVGEMRETTATLLDLFPVGPVLSIAGAKTLICWERIVLVELVPD